MNKFMLTLFLTAIVTINNLRICQATLYTYANNVKEDHIPSHKVVASSSSSALAAATATHYLKENKETPHHHQHQPQTNNQLKFHNIEKNLLQHDDHSANIAKYPLYDDIQQQQHHQHQHQPIYNPSKLYTSVDYNVEHDNDVDDAYNKEPYQHQQQSHHLHQIPQLPAQYHPQLQQLDETYDFAQQQEKPSLLKQLQSQHQELSEGYAVFLQEPYQQVVAPPEAESGSSNDHPHQQQQLQQQQKYVTSYVTPAPLNTKIHLNLQHHQQQYNHNNIGVNNINKPTIVSYAATGNDASPPSTATTTSINSQNMLQYGVKYVTNNNELNSYQNLNPHAIIRQPALKYGQPGGSQQPGSKQYIYAPMRSAVERKLPYSSKSLPYPPSFISLTTTEKPSRNSYYSYNHKSAYKPIPDFFSNRHSKSLLESYIPSWQVTKMLQEYESKQGSHQNHDNNNLHTLAFVMPYKNYYKRELKKGKK